MLNRHNLNIATLASKEESRFPLNAIHVTKEYTAESDGLQLVMVTRPKLPNGINASNFPKIPGQPAATDEHKPFLLPAGDAKELAKSLPKKSTIPILQCAAIAQVEEPTGDGDRTKLRTTVMTTDLSSAKFVRPDMPGNFPDIARVIPNPNKAQFSIAVNARMLKDLMAQVESFGDKRAPVVRFYFSDDQSAIRFDADGGDDQHMTGVLMPMRADYGTYSEVHYCANCQKDVFQLRKLDPEQSCCHVEGLDLPAAEPEVAAVPDYKLSVELVPELDVPAVSLAPEPSEEHPLGCECGTCVPVAGDPPSTPEWASAPESDPAGDLITAADVGKILGIHQGTVYTFVKQQRIPAPAHKIGRSAAWMRTEIEAARINA